MPIPTQTLQRPILSSVVASPERAADQKLDSVPVGYLIICCDLSLNIFRAPLVFGIGTDHPFQIQPKPPHELNRVFSTRHHTEKEPAAGALFIST